MHHIPTLNTFYSGNARESSQLESLLDRGCGLENSLAELDQIVNYGVDMARR